jgi:hypothetical protein
MGVTVENGVTIQDHICQLTTKAGEKIECAHMRIFVKDGNALAVVSQMPRMWKKNFIARTPRAIALYEQAIGLAGVEESHFTYVEHFHPEVSNLDGREFYAVVKPFRTEKGDLTIREESKDRLSVSKNQVQTLLNERVLAVARPELEASEPGGSGSEEVPFWLSAMEDISEPEEDEPEVPRGGEEPVPILASGLEAEAASPEPIARDPKVIFDPLIDTSPLSPEELFILQQWEGAEVGEPALADEGVREL